MKILHLDIETAPNKVYSWGLFKQNISINQIVEPGYTLCYAAKWHEDDEVIFDSIHKSPEPDFIHGVWKLINEADAVVHYNGEKFDMPTLNKEFFLNDLAPPDSYHNIDLYKTVKKRFRFASNKLDFVCQQLGIGAKTQHTGMSLWNDCMAGDEESWKLMEKYNKQDVVLTQELYELLLPWIQRHPNHALYLDTDRPVCPNCGSTHVVKKGLETTLTMAYQRYRCQNCSTPIRGRNNTMTTEKKLNVLTTSKL